MMTESNVDTNTPAPLDHVVFTEFEGGEGVLVDLQTKRYYQLNETAALVWRALEQGRGREGIVSELTARYDVMEEHARRSVENILRRFESYKLLRAAG